MLNMKNATHFCFQEAVLSAIIITLYVIFTDWVDNFIDKHSLQKWQKYLLIMVLMFVATFLSVIMITIIFGYKCYDKKK